MGDMLARYQWSHFHTLTFRIVSGEEYADREVRRFLRRVQLVAGVRVPWFFGLEYGEHFGRLHAHALTGNTERVPTPLLADEWRAGHSRIVGYDPARGAAHYIAKYVSKSLAEWDISPRPDLTDAVRAARAGTEGEARRLADRQRLRDRAMTRLRHHSAMQPDHLTTPQLPLD